MACLCYYNPSLCAYTLSAQTIDAGGVVGFNVNKLLTGRAVQHAAGSPTVTITKPGIYFVSVDMDVMPNASGNVAVQLNNNDVAIPDAVMSYTGTAADTNHVHLDTLVRVMPSCCAMDNTANITVSIGTESTVTNAKIIVL